MVAITKVFVVSFVVYAVLNTIENYIHYTIGRMSDRHTFKLDFQKPSLHDMLKIFGVMVVFAFLHAFITSFILA